MSFKFTTSASNEPDRTRTSDSDLLLTASDDTLGHLRAILDRIGDCPDGSPLAKVRRIYEWMSQYVLHRSNTFPDAYILETGFGNEHQRAKLFAQLCCLAGVDAQIYVGAILPRGDLPGLDVEVRHVKACSNPLGQVWVAVPTPEGTIEIDFGERYRPWSERDSGSNYRLKTAVSSLYAMHPRHWNTEAMCWSDIAVPAAFSLSTRLERSTHVERAVVTMAHA